MELYFTIGVVVVFGLLTGFAAWKSSRPRKDSLKPRWISWPLVTLFAGAIMLLAGSHAMNLMGIHTGAGRPPV